ncbi:DUF1801 domain-containing protein [uncultured Nitratireductor sp.]|uniref:DUF1801 domain-containing protein n=1 Tax=uncultured Nitratireductor sp. TaxID=520953 RepID=UPI0025EE9E1B|nr:DUF1801 domain-containing protein [uncultured Nitratireductor sp.]
MDYAFPAPEIADAFAAFPATVRPRLLRARTLILETAYRTEGVGHVEETLKWGQPAYLTPDTKSGSTIRLGVPRSQPDGWALFVHCQTDLVQQFRTHYPGHFTFEEARALLFKADEEIPERALSHCIALALTYHRRRI